MILIAKCRTAEVDQANLCITQNTNFDLARISVLLHSSNYFDGDEFVQFAVITLHDFAERALSQQFLDLVPRSDEFTLSDNNVSVSVV